MSGGWCRLVSATDKLQISTDIVIGERPHQVELLFEGMEMVRESINKQVSLRQGLGSIRAMNRLNRRRRLFKSCWGDECECEGLLE